MGLKGSPDLAAAADVAKYLKTVHHSFEFTVQEGMDAVEDVRLFYFTLAFTSTRRHYVSVYIAAVHTARILHTSTQSPQLELFLDSFSAQ